MYISKITLDNFKSFQGYGNKLTLNKKINFFVGNNNTGKTTILNAISFITDKKSRSEVISKDTKDEDHVAVTLIIRGELSDHISSDENLKKYSGYIQTDGEGEFLQVCRSSENVKVVQGTKPVELTIEKIRIFNPVTKQYENPVGFDSPFKSFFSTQFVWADDMPSDYMDFGTTKVCGKLLNATASAFFKSKKWTDFQKAHKTAFSDGEDSLEASVKTLAKDIENVVKDQYGDTSVKFQFSLPDASGFVKNGTFILEDDGVATEATAKGTGMQRALALAVIQVYAKVSRKVGSTVPLVFLLDEPETFLHPRAQDKLLKALDSISETNQIFVTTHSPYLLKNFRATDHTLYIFSKNKGVSKVDSSQTLSTFSAASPTLGEINYFAFGVTSVEFHNELYGYIQAQKALSDDKYWKEPIFDQYLATCDGLTKNKTWIRNDKPEHPGYQSTIATYVRDCIHHPENTLNIRYTLDELEDSTKRLLKIVTDGI